MPRFEMRSIVTGPARGIMYRDLHNTTSSAQSVRDASQPPPLCALLVTFWGSK